MIFILTLGGWAVLHLARAVSGNQRQIATWLLITAGGLMQWQAGRMTVEDSIRRAGYTIDRSGDRLAIGLVAPTTTAAPTATPLWLGTPSSGRP